MKCKRVIVVGICGLLLAVALSMPQVYAQVQGEWSTPYRLSTHQGKASEASLATDAHGYVHAFWSEVLFQNESSVLQYARFDGGSWTTPLDLHRSPPFFPIQSLSPYVDQHNTLHLAWSGGENGPIYYMNAPAAGALSAQHWTEPRRIAFPAKQLELLVDSKGVLHILYSRISSQARGLYYTHSQDQGVNWSEPVWLDPDILPGYTAAYLQFEVDDADGLHAAWFYSGVETQGGDWVRYAHSLDGGDTWSLPFTIDKHIAGSDDKLTFAYPLMAVSGQTVHIVWAAGSSPYRNHRYSLDGGLTWSVPRRIFGQLHGQAFESLAKDGLGRVHFLGQIRNPMGIYHSVWDETGWTKPALIYLVSLGDGDPIGDRVHAHYTISTVRAGNQLLLTFTDSPPEAERRLFATYLTLNELAPFTAVPTPTPTMTPTPSPSPTTSAATAVATATPMPSLDTIEALPASHVPRPDQAIWLGIVPPALFLLVGIVIFRMVSRKRN